MSLGRRSYGAPVSSVDPTSMLAHPKVKPAGEPIDYTVLEHAKNPPDRSRSFLDLVRGEVCCVNFQANAECGGKTEAAHLDGGNSMSMKGSDLLAVPLCTNHHVAGPGAQHRVGTMTFQLNYGINLWEVVARLQAKFIRAGITKKGQR